MKSVSLTFQLKRGDLFFKVAPLHPFGPNFFPFNFQKLSFGYVVVMDILYDSGKAELLKVDSRGPTARQHRPWISLLCDNASETGHAHLKLIT